MDTAIVKLATPRGGAFHRDEVYACGGDYQLVWRRVRAGRWIQVDCDVFLLPGFPPSVTQRRWIGLLAGGPGAHLSFEAAAEIHRMDGVRRGLAAVTVNHPHHLRIEGVELHQLDDVLPHHLMMVRDWPVTTPARTILDLAARISRVRLGVALEDSIVRKLTSFGELDAVLRDVRRRGKPGIRKLVTVLDERDGEPPPASELERLLARAIAAAGVRASRQHPLPTREPVRGLVDAAVVESKLILEADGRRWHARLQAMAKDRHRDREAARLGWQTLRFVYEDLQGDLAGVADDILTTHRLRAHRGRG